MTYRSILCPKVEDHNVPKKLLFVSEEAIYVNCHAHAWIKIEFIKAGKKLNFENVAVITRSLGPRFGFQHTPLPVLASGEFKMKPSFKKHKENAEYYQRIR